MRISEIYKILDTFSPFELQEDWDNSGLLIGNFDDEFEQIYVCFDLGLELLQNIKDNSLIITHHPIIFSSFKKLNFNDLSSKLIKELIKKDIKLISLHTNFDKTHLNKYVVTNILGFNAKEDNFLCFFDFDGNIDELFNIISSKLKLSYKRIVYSNNKQKLKVAVCVGSGMSLLKEVEKNGCDCFLTGDIKYHDANEAIAKNISLIDIGHYESEVYFTELMFDMLKSINNNCYIEKLISKNPFN